MPVISNNKITSRQKLFETWFSSYAKGLLGYAREFVTNQQEAEDIVHDVFANLWEKMDGVCHDAVKTYLFRSTRNKCLDHISHLKVRTKYQQETIDRGDPPDAFSPDFYIPSQLQAFLDAAIDRLTPQQKKVFVKNKIEDMPMELIAAEMNISARTAEKHLELASKTLRQYLSENMYLLMLFLLYLRR